MARSQTTPFQINFKDTFPVTNTGMQTLLEANTAVTYTVPGTSDQIYRAKFSCQTGAEVWIGFNVVATVPTSNTVTNISKIEFIPLFEARYVSGGDTISIISTGTPQVGISLLLVQDIS